MHIGIQNFLSVDLSIYKTIHVSFKMTGGNSATIWYGVTLDTVTAVDYRTLNNLYEYKENPQVWGSSCNITNTDMNFTFEEGQNNSYIYIGFRTGYANTTNKTLEIYKIWLTE